MNIDTLGFSSLEKKFFKKKTQKLVLASDILLLGSSSFPFLEGMRDANEELDADAGVSAAVAVMGEASTQAGSREADVIACQQFTNEQLKVYEAAKQRRCLCLTAAAGCGKTFVLKVLAQWFRERKICTVTTAMTGTAATHFGGHTFHGWMGLGIECELLPIPQLVRRLKKSPEAWQRWRQVSVLMIDEISMMPPRLFEMFDRVARLIRSTVDEKTVLAEDLPPPENESQEGALLNASLPFGGIQVIVIGDFAQLAPVVKRSPPLSGSSHHTDVGKPPHPQHPQKTSSKTNNSVAKPPLHQQLAQPAKSAKSAKPMPEPTYCFELELWGNVFQDNIFCLTRSFRQGEDQAFIDLLNRCRLGSLSQKDLQALQSRVVGTPNRNLNPGPPLLTSGRGAGQGAGHGAGHGPAQGAAQGSFLGRGSDFQGSAFWGSSVPFHASVRPCSSASSNTNNPPVATIAVQKLAASPLILFARRNAVDQYNRDQLEALLADRKRQKTEKLAKIDDTDAEQEDEGQAERRHRRQVFVSRSYREMPNPTSGMQQHLQNFLTNQRRHAQAPRVLELCLGARVMLVANLDVERGLCNGALGEVVGFQNMGTARTGHDAKDMFRRRPFSYYAMSLPDIENEEDDESLIKRVTDREYQMRLDKIKWPIVRFKSPPSVNASAVNASGALNAHNVNSTGANNATPVSTQTQDSKSQDSHTQDRLIVPHKWEWRENAEAESSFAQWWQVPLRLAWSMTVNKSQGASCDALHIDTRDFFGAGQLYTALSRAQKLQSVTLSSFHPRMVKTHDAVRRFYALTRPYFAQTMFLRWTKPFNIPDVITDIVAQYFCK